MAVDADAEARAIIANAIEEAGAARRTAELEARAGAWALRETGEASLAARQDELDRAADRAADRERALAALAAEAAARAAAVEAEGAAIAAREAAARDAQQAARAAAGGIRAALERAVGDTAEALRRALIESEVDEARAAAAHSIRAVDQAAGDAEQGRRAKRVMGIAVGRFSGHYLTERLHAHIPLGSAADVERIIGPDETHLRAVEKVAGVRLLLSDGRDGVRLEGLDGVGREVARRCLAWLSRHAPSAPGKNGPAAADRVERAARDIAQDLDREVEDLGRRAFSVLEIERSHPDIVKLVGRLNYRTSFTQNQWKHAIEAAFLCGMMAEELALDVKVARRAALMHDIGKALTHELDGSHAVIGADYARRLGETEVVANAIGAHHTDEPFSSPYAYLVAAADAMSGARPGARRQMEENFVGKVADLERITRGFAGVEEAFAVQGGREVRVYVREDRVDDAAAVGLSSEIARKISNEMTFPGQIKVTVIRELRAVEIAS